ncbi:hypothetical protein [Microbacterium sp. H1-D42]|uniref:hypothetical protein n=1 Tax=Microbacterium sp. H1-D42 TaxID=2925844 RepID=UPI001F53000F|nr:hypothetical protein [Microbacterium sp. H1-D42]UNK69639.1 hypothetical protein MNR00_10670 [Microbacterium sp. H1-D42]
MSPATRLHRLLLIPVLAALSIALTGCLAAMIADASEDAPHPASTADGNWSELAPCDLEGTAPWILVEDFPTEVVDATGLVPECGDIWTDAGRPVFASIVLDRVSTAQIDSIRSALVAADYDLLVDDFDPTAPSGDEYYGALDFYLDGVSEGDFTRVALEIYPSPSTDDAWMMFFDFESPSVRALEG